MNTNKPSVRRFLERSRRRSGASTVMALLVFMGVLLIGGFLGQYISAFIPLGLGTISIGLYTFSIWGFVVTAIVTFPILIYAIRHSQNTERVLTHG